MTAKHLALAINPDASFGAKRGIGERAIEYFRAAGHRVDVYSASSAEELSARLRAALDAGVDALVVVGGDGMVSLALAELEGRDIGLGVIPSGTGNDLVRGLGMDPRDTEAALRRVNAALETGGTHIDLGEITWEGGRRLFAGVLNMGFDALVNARANIWRWPKGKQRYVLALLRELLTLRPRRYRIEINGVAETVPALIFAVANNSSIGGGMKIVPHAKIDDGILHLFAVAPAPRIKFILLFRRVFRGTHLGISQVSVRDITEVTVLTGDVFAFADGERVAKPPFSVRVLPGALRVLS